MREELRARGQPPTVATELAALRLETRLLLWQPPAR